MKSTERPKWRLLTQFPRSDLECKFASTFFISSGDGLTRMGVTADGALYGIDVAVVGVFTTGIKEMHDRALRLTVSAAQELLQSSRITKLVVGLDRTENTDSVFPSLLAKTGRKDITVKK